MPISQADLTAVLNHADVEFVMRSTRIIESNQKLICDSIKALGFSDALITELEVRFSLTAANNVVSRSSIFGIPYDPRRGTIAERSTAGRVTTAELQTINADSSVVAALELSEVTDFELERIAQAIFAAALALNITITQAEVYSRYFAVELAAAVGGVRVPCSTKDCPKQVKPV